MSVEEIAPTLFDLMKMETYTYEKNNRDCGVRGRNGYGMRGAR